MAHDHDVETERGELVRHRLGGIVRGKAVAHLHLGLARERPEEDLRRAFRNPATARAWASPRSESGFLGSTSDDFASPCLTR